MAEPVKKLQTGHQIGKIAIVINHLAIPLILTQEILEVIF